LSSGLARLSSANRSSVIAIKERRHTSIRGSMAYEDLRA
jgi:hypothetical protein